jgi:hypothetical protein
MSGIAGVLEVDTTRQHSKEGLERMGAVLPTAQEILTDPRTLGRGYFSEETIKKMLKQHLTGKRD